MKVFQYIFYRIFSAYAAKNDSPAIRTFFYLALLQFFIACSSIIILEKTLVTTDALNKSVVDAITKTQYFWITIAAFILTFTYIYFFRRDLSYYENMFAQRAVLNRSIKLWMLIVLPFLILLLAISIVILLFGGVVFGKKIDGVF